MLSDVCLGSYDEVVLEMQGRLETLAGQCHSQLNVALVGHGGRDTWLSLALVQAASCARLRGRVHVLILSSTWLNDGWEPSMQEYLNALEQQGHIAPGCITFTVFHYQRPYSVLTAELAHRLQGANLVVQAEQGVDIFVPPGRFGKSPLIVPFLQDNFEDWFMLHECTKYCATNNVPMWMLETNPPLDIGAGIDGDELNRNIFDGRLQIEKFEHSVLVGTKEGRLIDICLSLRDATVEVKTALLRDAGIRDFDAQTVPLTGFYAGLVMFTCLKFDTAAPIAGFLELLLKLIKTEKPLPSPQWLLARHIMPGEIGLVRVLTDLDVALQRLPTNASHADWLFSIMLFRRHTPQVVFPEQPPGADTLVADRTVYRMCSSLFWALNTAEQVLAQCPDFDLWQHEGLLLTALTKLQFDICGLYCCLPLQAMDFTCRLLELRKVMDINMYCDYLCKHFLRGKDFRNMAPNASPDFAGQFKALAGLLVTEWQVCAEVGMHSDIQPTHEQ